MTLARLAIQQAFQHSHGDGYSVDEAQFFLRFSADKCVYSEAVNTISAELNRKANYKTRLLVFTPSARWYCHIAPALNERLN
jgi:hypothetical protein